MSISRSDWDRVVQAFRESHPAARNLFVQTLRGLRDRFVELYRRADTMALAMDAAVTAQQREIGTLVAAAESAYRELSATLVGFQFRDKGVPVAVEQASQLERIRFDSLRGGYILDPLVRVPTIGEAGHPILWLDGVNVSDVELEGEVRYLWDDSLDTGAVLVARAVSPPILRPDEKWSAYQFGAVVRLGFQFGYAVSFNQVECRADVPFRVLEIATTPSEMPDLMGLYGDPGDGELSTNNWRRLSDNSAVYREYDPVFGRSVALIRDDATNYGIFYPAPASVLPVDPLRVFRVTVSARALEPSILIVQVVTDTGETIQARSFELEPAHSPKRVDLDVFYPFSSGAGRQSVIRISVRKGAVRVGQVEVRPVLERRTVNSVSSTVHVVPYTVSYYNPLGPQNTSLLVLTLALEHFQYGDGGFRYELPLRRVLPVLVQYPLSGRMVTPPVQQSLKPITTFRVWVDGENLQLSKLRVRSHQMDERFVEFPMSDAQNSGGVSVDFLPTVGDQSISGSTVPVPLLYREQVFSGGQEFELDYVPFCSPGAMRKISTLLGHYDPNFDPLLVEDSRLESAGLARSVHTQGSEWSVSRSEVQLDIDETWVKSHGVVIGRDNVPIRELVSVSSIYGTDDVQLLQIQVGGQTVNYGSIPDLVSYLLGSGTGWQLGQLPTPYWYQSEGPTNAYAKVDMAYHYHYWGYVLLLASQSAVSVRSQGVPVTNGVYQYSVFVGDDDTDYGPPNYNDFRSASGEMRIRLLILDSSDQVIRQFNITPQDYLDSPGDPNYRRVLPDGWRTLGPYRTWRGMIVSGTVTLSDLPAGCKAVYELSARNCRGRAAVLRQAYLYGISSGDVEDIDIDTVRYKWVLQQSVQPVPETSLIAMRLSSPLSSTRVNRVRIPRIEIQNGAPMSGISGWPVWAKLYAVTSTSDGTQRIELTPDTVTWTQTGGGGGYYDGTYTDATWLVSGVSGSIAGFDLELKCAPNQDRTVSIDLWKPLGIQVDLVGWDGAGGFTVQWETLAPIELDGSYVLVWRERASNVADPIGVSVNGATVDSQRLTRIDIGGSERIVLYRTESGSIHRIQWQVFPIRQDQSAPFEFSVSRTLKLTTLLDLLVPVRLVVETPFGSYRPDTVGQVLLGDTRTVSGERLELASDERLEQLEESIVSGQVQRRITMTRPVHATMFTPIAEDRSGTPLIRVYLHRRSDGARLRELSRTEYVLDLERGLVQPIQDIGSDQYLVADYTFRVVSEEQLAVYDRLVSGVPITRNRTDYERGTIPQMRPITFSPQGMRGHPVLEYYHDGRRLVLASPVPYGESTRVRVGYWYIPTEPVAELVLESDGSETPVVSRVVVG